MASYWKAKLLGIFLLSFTGAPTSANVWQICDLELNITELVTQPYPRIRAFVQSVTPRTATVECPPTDSEVFFYPGRADYQGILPRRNWPNPGQTVRWRYMYLDGECKNSGSCRIEHYPVGW